MKIEFDPKKNQRNKDKHGLYLKDAEYLDWDNMLACEDTDVSYGETRYFGITYGMAYLGNRIYAVVFTYREENNEDIYRIISLRKATKVEIRKYAKT
ncbi:MAG TPA: BrnT family toxin [Arsenophonus nasoniae]|uniref:BrnT family toxin n=1 Tax=Arsenophonus nasoniae TaxID=638 RepID=UPI003879CB38